MYNNTFKFTNLYFKYNNNVSTYNQNISTKFLFKHGCISLTYPTF